MSITSQRFEYENKPNVLLERIKTRIETEFPNYFSVIKLELNEPCSNSNVWFRMDGIKDEDTAKGIWIRMHTESGYDYRYTIELYINNQSNRSYRFLETSGYGNYPYKYYIDESLVIQSFKMLTIGRVNTLNFPPPNNSDTNSFKVLSLETVDNKKAIGFLAASKRIDVNTFDYFYVEDGADPLQNLFYLKRFCESDNVNFKGKSAILTPLFLTNYFTGDTIMVKNPDIKTVSGYDALYGSNYLLDNKKYINFTDTGYSHVSIQLEE